MKTVVKSNGKVEPYSSKKLQDSIYKTLMSIQVPQGQAVDIIDRSIKEFETWQKDNDEITTHDIILKMSSILEKSHSEAAYIFKNFKKMI